MAAFLTSNRGIFTLIAFAGGCLMITALFLQHVLGLEPCNLCMFQRVFVVSAALIALIAAIHGAQGWGAKVYAALIAILTGTGAGTAARQLWLQSLPADQVPACGPGLDYMLDAYPFMEMIIEVLRGSGDCAKVQWVFMGLSIPGWTFICFSAATLLSLFIIFRPKARLDA